MNAQELRIGSMFYPINRNGEVHLPVQIPFKVFTIEPFKVTACHADENFAHVNQMIEFDIKDVSEIPLTEEWLLKLGGFKHENKFGEWFSFNWGSNGVTIVKFNTHYNKYCYELCQGFNKILDYVHQFQNIHHSITGEELTIK